MPREKSSPKSARRQAQSKALHDQPLPLQTSARSWTEAAPRRFDSANQPAATATTTSECPERVTKLSLSSGDHSARSVKLLLGNQFVAGLGSHWAGVRAVIIPRPEGTSENSPRFQPWVTRQNALSPEGTADNHRPLFTTPSKPFKSPALLPLSSGERAGVRAVVIICPLDIDKTTHPSPAPRARPFS